MTKILRQKVSLDEVMSERQFSARNFNGKDGLTKLFKAPSSFKEAAEEGDSASARFIMTAQVSDRYGDVVVTKGGDTAEFEKNPVVLWAHNSRAFPIGMWSDLQKISGSPKRMEGTANFNPAGVNDDSDMAVRLISAGHLRACSIGFIPTDYEVMRDEDTKQFLGYQFNEWELLECSVCSIPANPAALVKSAGGDDRFALQAIELVLDEWARTPTGKIISRKSYEDAYKVTKAKEVTLHEVRAVPEEEPTLKPAAPASAQDIAKEVATAMRKDREEFAKQFMEPSFWQKVAIGIGLVKAPEAVEPPTIELAAEPDSSKAEKAAKAAAEQAERDAQQEADERAAAEKQAADDAADEHEVLLARARALALED